MRRSQEQNLCSLTAAYPVVLWQLKPCMYGHPDAAAATAAANTAAAAATVVACFAAPPAAAAAAKVSHAYLGPYIYTYIYIFTCINI